MKKIIFAAIALAITITSSCKKDSTTEIEDPKKNLIKIADAFAIGSAAKVEIWSATELNTGYQKLYIALSDSVSGKSIIRSSVQILPMMDMNMNGMKMSHSAPLENPESQDADNTLFPCAAVFTMPSTGESGKWRLIIMVKKDGQTKYGKAEIPIQVKQSPLERVKTITAADGSKLTVAYISPSSPKVGVNDFEMAIFNRLDMMTFPPDNSYTINMTPEMPSMGHGSPNNVNPTLTKNGHYKGKVNFTMTGDWRINLVLNKEGKSTSTFFDLLF
jgi:hypothetical protein